MSFYVIGDLHFKTDNTDSIRKFTEKVIPSIKEKNPDYIVVLGDVLHNHERLHTIPFNFAISFLKTLSELKPTYVLVGNHDMINNQQFLTEQHWMNALKNCDNLIVVDKIVELKIDEYLILFLPFIPTGRFKEALNTYEHDWKYAKLIFAHQEFLGANLGGKISEDGDAWKQKYPFVISGHIHGSQYVNENIFYVGEAIPSLTKTINAFVNICEEIKIEEIDLKLPKKVNYHISFEDINTFVVEDHDNINNIYISSTHEEFKIAKNKLKGNFKLHREPREIKMIRSPETQEDFMTILNNLIEKNGNKNVKKVFQELINSSEFKN